MERSTHKFDLSESVKDSPRNKFGNYILRGPSDRTELPLDQESPTPKESTAAEVGIANVNEEFDWVLVDSTEAEEIQLCCLSDQEQPVNITAVVTAGAAGMLLMGPMAGAIVAVGTLGYCSGLAECREVGCKAADVLADRARQAIAVGKIVHSALSDTVIAEHDRTIENLQSSKTAEAKKYNLNMEFPTTLKAHVDTALRLQEQVIDAERRWRDQIQYMNSRIVDAEQAHAEVLERLRQDLEAARLAKDEEVERLSKILEATEQTLELDAARLTAELEHHRHEQLALREHLLAEKQESHNAWQVELLTIQNQLVVIERERTSAAKECQRIATSLAEVTRQNEEESDSKRCIICMDRDRQTLFLPCRHVVCCHECAVLLQTCPIDRSMIAQKIDMLTS